MKKEDNEDLYTWYNMNINHRLKITNFNDEIGEHKRI